MAELEDGDLVDSIYCFVALITMTNNQRAWKVEPSEPKLGLTFLRVKLYIQNSPRCGFYIGVHVSNYLESRWWRFVLLQQTPKLYLHHREQVQVSCACKGDYNN